MKSTYLHLLWKKYIEPFDPLSTQLQLALRCCLTTMLGIGIALYFKIPQAIWLIFPIIFVSLMSLGITRTARFKLQFLGGLLVTFSVFIAALAGHYFYLYLILMTLLTFITFYSAKYGPDFFRLFIFSAILALVSANQPATLHDALMRAFLTEIGALMALLTTWMLWPYNPRKMLKKLQCRNQKLLFNSASAAIFNALRGNFHRTRQFELKSKALDSLHQSRLLVNAYPCKKTAALLAKQTELFEELITVSDILNKPNTEYLLDLITDELHLLTKGFHQPAKERHKTLEKAIMQLKEKQKEYEHRPLIKNDLLTLSYLFELILKTTGAPA